MSVFDPRQYTCWPYDRLVLERSSTLLDTYLFEFYHHVGRPAGTVDAS